MPSPSVAFGCHTSEWGTALCSLIELKGSSMYEFSIYCGLGEMTNTVEEMQWPEARGGDWMPGTRN